MPKFSIEAHFLLMRFDLIIAAGISFVSFNVVRGTAQQNGNDLEMFNGLRTRIDHLKSRLDGLIVGKDRQVMSAGSVALLELIENDKASVDLVSAEMFSKSSSSSRDLRAQSSHSNNKGSHSPDARFQAKSHSLRVQRGQGESRAGDAAVEGSSSGWYLPGSRTPPPVPSFNPAPYPSLTPSTQQAWSEGAAAAYFAANTNTNGMGKPASWVPPANPNSLNPAILSAIIASTKGGSAAPASQLLPLLLAAQSQSPAVGRGALFQQNPAANNALWASLLLSTSDSPASSRQPAGGGGDRSLSGASPTAAPTGSSPDIANLLLLSSLGASDNVAGGLNGGGANLQNLYYLTLLKSLKKDGTQTSSNVGGGSSSPAGISSPDMTQLLLLSSLGNNSNMGVNGVGGGGMNLQNLYYLTLLDSLKSKGAAPATGSGLSAPSGGSSASTTAAVSSSSPGDLSPLLWMYLLNGNNAKGINLPPADPSLVAAGTNDGLEMDSNLRYLGNLQEAMPPSYLSSLGSQAARMGAPPGSTGYGPPFPPATPHTSGSGILYPPVTSQRRDLEPGGMAYSPEILHP